MEEGTFSKTLTKSVGIVRATETSLINDNDGTPVDPDTDQASSGGGSLNMGYLVLLMVGVRRRKYSKSIGMSKRLC